MIILLFYHPDISHLNIYEPLFNPFDANDFIFNPHYFCWLGRPTVLITSGEHYGAVLNQAFDYQKYLKTLRLYGFNLTRTFSGVYCEHAGAFKIEGNTLAPKKGDLLCPWARSKEGGYANGGNKFDLTQWDPVYFKRLHDFLREAGKREVVVEALQEVAV